MNDISAITFHEIIRYNPETFEGNGLVIAVFDNNATGSLAPFNGMMVVGTHEEDPTTQTATVRLWEWESGIPIPQLPTTMGESPSSPTNTTTAATTDATAAETNATTMTPTTTNSYYTDTSKAFRVQVPEGWVVDQLNKTNPSLNQLTIPDYGIEFLIAMCPQEISLPAPGRLHTCPDALPFTATGMFQLYRFIDLQDRPELTALVQQGEPITTDDLLALYIDYQRNLTFYDPLVYQSIQLATNEDIEVSIVDPQNNNQTVGAAQAKFVEFTHTDSNGYGSYKQSALLVLSSDANTGYVISPIVAQLSNQELPGFATQVINSFELIAASGPGEADDAVNLE